jgi:cytosine permease
VLLAVWVTVLLTDYYIVRGKMRKGNRGIARLQDIPQFNWNGILTLIVSTLVGMAVNHMGWFPIPFVISTLFAFVMYTSVAYFQTPAVHEDQEVKAV